MIGKIERLPLREVWSHEALDFTTWLQENIDVLNDILDLSLSSAEREQSAGDFNVDLLAEDEGGNPVVIENQLEKSNHDHLGKLITYLTAVESKTAIWIVAEPRAEHVKAIAWLNEASPAAFHLLKVEAIRIGESPPAPLLTLIVGPSDEAREVGKTKKELAERYVIRHRFWTQLLERARQKTNLHANISPSKANWASTGAGKSGLQFSYVIRQHEANVELFIDRGHAAENEAISRALAACQEDIEAGFGESLEWYMVPGVRSCRIKRQIDVGGYRDEEKWPEIHEAMIDAMIRLERVLRPHIDKLDV